MKRLFVFLLMFAIVFTFSEEKKTKKDDPDKKIIAIADKNIKITQREWDVFRYYRIYFYSNHIDKKYLPTEPEFIKTGLKEILFNRIITKEIGKKYENNEELEFLTNYYTSMAAIVIKGNDLYMNIKLNITPEEIKKYYEENKKKFERKAKISFQYLFLLADKTVSEKEKKRKEKLIKELYKKIKKNPEKFGEIIKKYSEAASKKFEGKIENINADALLPELLKELKKLKKGEISKPKFIKNGYYIFKLLGYKPARYYTLKEATPIIKNIIANKRRNELYPEEKEKLIKDYLGTLNFPKKFDLESDYKKVLFTIPQLGEKITYEKLTKVVDENTLRRIFTDDNKREKYLKRLAFQYAAYIDLLIKKEKNTLAIKRLIREVLIANKFINDYFKNHEIKLSELELKSYYEKNKHRFMKRPEYYIKYILVKTPKYNEKSVQEKHYAFLKAEKLAKEIYSDLVKNSYNFKDIEKKYSNSDLKVLVKNPGWIKTPFSAKIDLKLVKMKVGEISKPYKVKDGYMILYFIDYRKPQPRNFEEVKEIVKRNLYIQKRESIIREIVERYLKKYHAKVLNSLTSQKKKKN